MIALWTSKANVIGYIGGPQRAPRAPRRSETPRQSRGVPRIRGVPCGRGSRAASVMRREELHDEGRDAVLHLGERHRVDDLVADTVVVLSAEVRLAPQVVELHDAEGVRHLLRI